jgi:hypothetical protein
VLINVHPVRVSRAPDRAGWRTASSWRAALKPTRPTRRPSGADGHGRVVVPSPRVGRKMAMARDPHEIGALVPVGQMALPASRDGHVVARADTAGAVEQGPVRRLPGRIWQVQGWCVREHSGSMLALGPHAHKALAKGGVPRAFLPALGSRHGRWASKSWRALIPSDAMLSSSWLGRSGHYISEFRPTTNDLMRKRCKAQSGNPCPSNAYPSGVRSSCGPRLRAEPPTLSPAQNGPSLVIGGEVPAPATISGRISP